MGALARRDRDPGTAVSRALRLAALAAACLPAALATAQPLQLRAKVLASHPHRTDAYTQGLLWHDGALYESTGEYGSSRLRRVDIGTGEPLQEVSLPARLFGEGLERVGERLVQLTWREQEAWIWDLASFERLEVRRYEGEGWGLCFDGDSLVRSDGSARLVMHDPVTLAVRGEVTVTLDGAPLGWLNELECAEGWIYANVYQTERIVRIDGATGEVVAVIDASGLLTPAERQGTDVLNGIAYDESTHRFYLTGKRWPRLFEVVFVPPDRDTGP